MLELDKKLKGVIIKSIRKDIIEDQIFDNSLLTEELEVDSLQMIELIVAIGTEFDIHLMMKIWKLKF